MPVTPNEADSEDTADIATARRVMARITSGHEQLLTSAELDELLAAITPPAFYQPGSPKLRWRSVRPGAKRARGNRGRAKERR